MNLVKVFIEFNHVKTFLNLFYIQKYIDIMAFKFTGILAHDNN